MTMIERFIMFLITSSIGFILLYVIASVIYAISPWLAIALLLYIIVIGWFYLKYKAKLKQFIKKLIE